MSGPIGRLPAVAAILREYTARIEASQRHYAAIQRVVNAQVRVLTQSDQAIRRLVDQIASVDTVSRRLAVALRPAFEKLQGTLLNPDFLRRIQQSIEVWNARQREAGAILAEKGWWLAPDFSLSLLNSVIRLKAEGRARSINRLLCEHYSPRRLSAMMRRWEDEPLFERRKHLFREGLRAHRDRRWYLAIPLLLTQVEGILADFAGQRGTSKNASVKNMARALQVDPADTGNLVVQTWLAQLDAMFGSGFYDTEERHRGVRRNAILHGRELRYGSQVKSTQLWLQLDTIYWLISATKLPTPRVR